MGWIFGLLVSWIVNATVLAGVAWALADVTFDSSADLFIAAAIFGILNTILKPIVKFVTIPLAILTLGIAWFFVAMLMLAITDWLVSGFEIEGFWTYVWATIIVWVINLVLDLLLRPWRDRPQAAS